MVIGKIRISSLATMDWVEVPWWSGNIPRHGNHKICVPVLAPTLYKWVA